MGAVPQEEEEKEQEVYTVDWQKQSRRPFKRGFIPYGLGLEGEGGAAEAAARRKEWSITVVEEPAGEDQTPVPVDSWEAVGGVLPQWLLKALVESGEPSPLSSQALPIILAGQNLVAVASAPAGAAAAGFSSVLAYLVPGIAHVEDQVALSADEPGPVVVVLAPTQDAAAKVAAEATELLKHSPGGLRCVNVSGGGARSEKLKELGSAGAQFVVGTPKRVHDMVCKDQLSLLRTTYFVLDGADKISELGFNKEVRELGAWMRPERQTLVLATTWPRQMAQAAADLCYASGSPVHINVASGAPKAVQKRSRAEGAAAGASAAKAARTLPAKPKAMAAKAADEDFPEDW